jgi:hypothetical protein
MRTKEKTTPQGRLEWGDGDSHKLYRVTPGRIGEEWTQVGYVRKTSMSTWGVYVGGALRAMTRGEDRARRRLVELLS